MYKHARERECSAQRVTINNSRKTCAAKHTQCPIIYKKKLNIKLPVEAITLYKSLCSTSCVTLLIPPHCALLQHKDQNMCAPMFILLTVGEFSYALAAQLPSSNDSPHGSCFKIML